MDTSSFRKGRSQASHHTRRLKVRLTILLPNRLLWLFINELSIYIRRTILAMELSFGTSALWEN